VVEAWGGSSAAVEAPGDDGDRGREGDNDDNGRGRRRQRTRKFRKPYGVQSKILRFLGFRCAGLCSI
jgi:hypothetical protein